jgi:predicted Rdx family selenoprotein
MFTFQKAAPNAHFTRFSFRPDLGKTVFHMVGLNVRGEAVVRKKFSRTQLLRFTAKLRMRDSHIRSPATTAEFMISCQVCWRKRRDGTTVEPGALKTRTRKKSSKTA